MTPEPNQQTVQATPGRYPYTAWVLKPSFTPAECRFVRSYDSFQFPDTWDVSEAGKIYSIKTEIFATKELAVAAGWERLNEQEARLAKMRSVLEKKRAALAKAGAA
jgi:hypothetical protein